MEVETLIPQMQNTLSDIKITINAISTKAQEDELDQLEQKRERLLADLQISFERGRQELEAKRQKKLEEIMKKRKQEDEERAARRQQEDQELDKANFDEDVRQRKKHDSTADSIEDETERKMDEIEDVAQKVIREGKQKLRDLDEKRRELNRRIDEQLKQPLPTTPSRNRRRTEEGPGKIQKNGIVGGSLRNTNSNPSTSNKPDTASKNQQPPDTGSPAKSPEVKKDDKLFFQDKPDDPAQSEKESANNLPRSFAEAREEDMSNRSKGKLEHGKSSLNGLVQIETNRDKRNNEMTTIEDEKLDAQGRTVPLASLRDVTARGSVVMTLSDTDSTARDDKPIECANLSSNMSSQQENARSRGYSELSLQTPSTIKHTLGNHAPVGLEGLDLSFPQQTLLDPRPRFIEEQNHAVSTADPNRRNPIQPASDKLHIPITHDVETKQLSKSTPASERSRASESGRSNIYTPHHLSKEGANTVEYSKSTIRPSRLSITSEKRNPRRQNKETYDQMGFEQPTTSDILGQGLPEPWSPVAADRGQDTMTEHVLIIGRQAPRASTSPLPVENETVHGQDQLFDDDRSAYGSVESCRDEQLDLEPNTPIERQCLPALPEPVRRDTLCNKGSSTLIGDSSIQGILTEEEDEHRSASHLNLHERDHNGPGFARLLLDVNSSDDQGLSYSQYAPMNLLYSQALSGVVDQNFESRCFTAYDDVSIDPKKPKDKLRSRSAGPRSKRSKQRGRSRNRLFELPGRAPNPRELMFQGSEDEIDIRSAWFKHSKRGLG